MYNEKTNLVVVNVAYLAFINVVVEMDRIFGAKFIPQDLNGSI